MKHIKTDKWENKDLMKVAIECLETLVDKDLEEIVCVWNRKGRRIAV